MNIGGSVLGRKLQWIDLIVAGKLERRPRGERAMSFGI